MKHKAGWQNPRHLTPCAIDYSTVQISIGFSERTTASQSGLRRNRFRKLSDKPEVCYQRRESQLPAVLQHDNAVQNPFSVMVEYWQWDPTCTRAARCLACIEDRAIASEACGLHGGHLGRIGTNTAER